MRRLRNSYSEMFRVVQTGLLTDAEVGEDIAENFVCGDFSTCYLCEMGETLAEVFRYEVARDADGHCFYYCSDVSE